MTPAVFRASQVAPLRLRRLTVVLRWPVRGFVAVGSRHCGGHPGVANGARAFAGRSNVVLCRPVRGVARRGAIHDARCRNGTIGRPRWASADVAGRRPVRGFVLAGSWFCVGRPGVANGARAFAGRSNVVLCRPVRGVARRGAIHDARCRNGTIGRPRWASADVACCSRFAVLYWPVRGIAVVIRASQVAPVRLRGG